MSRTDRWKLRRAYHESQSPKAKHIYGKRGLCLACHGIILYDFKFEYQYCQTCVEKFGNDVFNIRYFTITTKLRRSGIEPTKELVEIISIKIALKRIIKNKIDPK